jgi:GTP-binding protein EngB required for normal cell division
MSLALNTPSSGSAAGSAGEPASPDIHLDEAIGQLHNPQAKVLMDTIDKLRELRVGEIVQLPQIIVVGDQSSGKSSVLEAISGMKFPVHGALCTRFATELILRKEPDIKITVSIQKATGESTQFHRTSLDKNTLPDIINEAQERMGVGHGSNAFSRDILRVVLTGPDVPQLTLVDLPGIFHSETSEQTFKGKKVVDELINQYMQESKSIILVVVAANNQLANQSVMSLAKRHDPQSSRLVGVITKPDLIDGHANEQKYLDLCRGLEPAYKLPLGWHVLRNSSEQERTDESHDRDREEQRFFQRRPWSSLPSADRGIEGLRNKLSRVLLEHIKGSLPGLIREIEDSLQAREEDLRQLGKPRSTPEEMRSFLLDISVNFQRLANDAVNGRYGDPFFGDLSSVDRKLRARIRHMNGAFDATMLSKGATYAIRWDLECNSSQDSEDVQTRSSSDLSADGDDEVPHHLKGLVKFYQGEFSDPLPVETSAIIRELEALASLNQGKELPGTPNAELAFRFFQKQARPWQGIGRFHLNQVLETSKNFVDSLFGCVVGADRDTTEAILKGCADPFFHGKSKLLEEKLQELLQPYTTGYGLALERDFRQRTSADIARQSLAMWKYHCPELLNKTATLNRDKVVRSIAKQTEDVYSDQFRTRQIIWMMKVHHEVSQSSKSAQHFPQQQPWQTELRLRVNIPNTAKGVLISIP